MKKTTIKQMVAFVTVSIMALVIIAQNTPQLISVSISIEIQNNSNEDVDIVFVDANTGFVKLIASQPARKYKAILYQGDESSVISDATFVIIVISAGGEVSTLGKVKGDDLIENPVIVIP